MNNDDFKKLIKFDEITKERLIEIILKESYDPEDYDPPKPIQGLDLTSDQNRLLQILAPDVIEQRNAARFQKLMDNILESIKQHAPVSTDDVFSLFRMHMNGQTFDCIVGKLWSSGKIVVTRKTVESKEGTVQFDEITLP